MKRGVITFTNKELYEISQSLSFQNCADDVILGRFKPESDDESKEVTIEVSENDAETVLDFLPIPATNTSIALTSSRTKLQNFITKCRFGSVSN